MKLTERESRLVMLLVLVTIVAFGTRYLVLPAYYGWQSSKAALRQSQLSDWNIGGKSNQGKEAAAQVDFELVPAPSPESLHYYFGSLAKDGGLSLGSINISENQGALPSGYKRMDVSISLMGPQDNIISFLTGIEESRAAVAAQSLSLKPDGQSVALDAVFRVYCEEKDKELPLFDEPAPPEAKGFRFAFTADELEH